MLALTLALLALAHVAHTAATPSCPAQDIPPLDPSMSLDATLFSATNFQGSTVPISVPAAFGCVDIPDLALVNSYLTDSTVQVTLHYGKGCYGPVLFQSQGGAINITEPDTPPANPTAWPPAGGACAGSVFLKYNRHGSI
ncbi:hypothetical protein RI367_006892 [Sorochytrium milnesiophthora]